MLLIADSGSTKTEWLLDDFKSEPQTFITHGMSPYFVTREDIFRILKTELKINYTAVENLFFYGTGVSNEDRKNDLLGALKIVFPKTNIEIHHDMLGAARALCGHEAGIATILGTGANSCLYDGKKITQEGNSLGYVLGDEGSGANLGKRLITAYLYHELPKNIEAKFDAKFKTSKGEILENVYKKPFPNRYLASFVPFMCDHIQDEFMHALVSNAFHEFIQRHIKCYPKHKELPVHITGSVGYYFFDVFKSICEKEEIKMGNFMKNPMRGLYEFHRG